MNTVDPNAERYLELLKGVLTRQLAPDDFYLIPDARLRKVNPIAAWTYRTANSFLLRNGLALCRHRFDSEVRRKGIDWPGAAETMVGTTRLNNVHDCIRTVLAEGVPGDFIETGVWRGGVTIFMRAALLAYQDQNRRVWVADSFEGLPGHDARFPHEDVGSTAHNQNDTLAVSAEDVRKNFRKFGLLDHQVEFLVGWFKDTLPTAPMERLAILRMDGDLYASTMDALVHLYPKLSVGGFCIVDDYGWWPSCAKAVNDYRDTNRITEPIIRIDETGVFWRRVA